jgi:hypothetical protein
MTIPFPSSATYCGLFFAESVKIRPFFLFTSPSPIGTNWTSTWQDWPAVSGTPEHPSCIIVKGASAATRIELIEADLERLVAVTVSAALFAFTVTCPKSSFLGLRVSVPAGRCLKFPGSAVTGSAATVALYASIHIAAITSPTRMNTARYLRLKDKGPAPWNKSAKTL